VVLNVVYSALEIFSRCQSAHTDATRLPSELLSQVFLHLDNIDRANTARVCRAWNSVLFSSPNIWRSIVVSPQHRPGTLEKQLVLSRNTTISLDVEVNGSNWAEVTGSLKRHLHRMHSLVLSIAVDFPDQRDSVTAISSAISVPAPALRELRVFDPCGILGQYSEELPLFGGVAPQLRLAKVQSDISALQHSKAFENVTHVLFKPVFELQLLDLQVLLELSPSLVDLSISVEDWDELAYLQQRVPIILAVPETLQRLLILANEERSYPQRIVDAFSREARIPEITISYRPYAATPAVTPLVNSITGGTGTVKTLRLEASTRTEGHLNVFTYAENLDVFGLASSAPLAANHRRSQLLNAHPSISFTDLDLFRSLVSLHVGEHVFCLPSATTFPEAPVLEHLTVITLNPAYQSLQDGTRRGVFGLSAQSQPQQRRALHAPKLKTLTITTRNGLLETDDGTPTWLAPTVVRGFIENFLEFDTKALELYFVGVALWGRQRLNLDCLGKVETKQQRLDWSQEFSDLLHWQ